MEDTAPPDRNECTSSRWQEYSDDDYVFDVSCWYKNGKLVDFHINMHFYTPHLPNKIGALIASADCKNDGTFHLHNEKRRHGPNIDIRPLRSHKDASEAFNISQLTMINYAASIRER